MKKVFKFLVLCGFVGLYSCQEQTKETKKSTPEIDVLAHVDPFIGTGFHGHTFPGPVRPHGMVQLSPDTKLNGWDASSGYHNDDKTIHGFSHTHLSGTGIGDMGDISLLPFTKSTTEKPVATFDKKDEEATVGHYKVTFNNFDVTTELAVTERVGIHKYQYKTGAQKKLLFDLAHTLQRTWGNSNLTNELEFVDSKTIEGLKHTKGWASDHTVYFHAEFSSPYVIDTLMIDNASAATNKSNVKGTDVYTYLSFPELKDNEPLLVKVSISPVDREGARKNMKAELDHWNFEQVVKETKDIWKNNLNTIKVSTPIDSVLTTFYTAMYHTKIAPMIYQDVDGRYRGMDLKIHQAKPGEINYTVFSLWDTFRAFHPMMTIIDEKRSVDWVNSLLLKYQEGQLLPKWPLNSNYTGTMVGYPAVANIADALTKNLPGIDTQLALEAALAGPSFQPELIASGTIPKIKRVMPEHNRYVNEGKHIPSDKISKSVSFGIENAYYDWCISEIAKVAKNDSIAKLFAQRGRNYLKYFDKSTGFMRGKNEDGSWRTPFNPKYSSHEGSDYVEGNAWQWTWFVPHDIEHFAQQFGGNEAFTTKLDTLFTTSSEIEGESASGDITGLIGQYAHGNEPSHHIAYMYTYAGKPYKTQKLVDYILKEFYTTKPDGIIGNEDCGQMSAWYILNAMGFYQVSPGDPKYTIGRPLFDTVEIPLQNGNTFSIITKNNSLENKYVQSVLKDGKPYDSMFFTHDDIKKGTTFTITMGPQPKK